MTVDKRKPARAAPPRPSGVVRVVESPRSIDATAHVAGAGQCLFLLFGDELRAFRQQQRTAATPAREVCHV